MHYSEKVLDYANIKIFSKFHLPLHKEYSVNLICFKTMILFYIYGDRIIIKKKSVTVPQNIFIQQLVYISFCKKNMFTIVMFRESYSLFHQKCAGRSA